MNKVIVRGAGNPAGACRNAEAALATGAEVISICAVSALLFWVFIRVRDAGHEREVDAAIEARSLAQMRPES